MLILGELDNVISQISQLQIRKAIISEIFQKS